jgi:hypothetical protein
MTRWLQAAKQEAAPRTKPTQPTKPKATAIETGADTTRRVCFVSFVGFVRRGGACPCAPVATPPRPEPDPAPPARAEGLDPASDAFPYGSANGLGLFPRTWTGRVVSLAAWRELTAWERHGPRGRLWNGATGRWELPEGSGKR